MKKSILFTLLIIGHNVKALSPFQKSNEWSAGLDISQFNYFINPGKKGLNMGIIGQYRPYRFLSLNGALIRNYTGAQRGQAIGYLNEYISKGSCIKLGFDVSLKIGKSPHGTRLFFGYQGMAIRYNEAGRFEKTNYWGTYTQNFETETKTVFAREVIFGLQFRSGRITIRPQVYSIFLKDDIRISHDNTIVEGYKSPFVPGLGFRRSGLNFIMLYRFGQDN